MAEGAEWRDYNEQNPFGKGATVVGGDNIAYSKRRVEAIRAVKAGTATAEQQALVQETDAIISQSLSERA